MLHIDIHYNYLTNGVHTCIYFIYFYVQDLHSKYVSWWKNLVDFKPNYNSGNYTKVNVKSSMAKSSPVQNLLPLLAGSSIKD